jgi:neutral ceramidase
VSKRLLRAGAAALNVDPPLGLPMVGVVRRVEPASERLGALEVSAMALEHGDSRVVLCGVDTLAIQSPEIDAIRERVVRATGALRAGVLINFGHTHHAPPGGRTIYGSFGERDPEPDGATLDYIAALHDRIVEVCTLARERLEPAALRWGLGQADLSINRRERDADGMVRRLGWHEAGMLDQSVPVLQARRIDETPIATLVAYGCHTVTTGVERLAYSADYPGVVRERVRHWTGGEAIFFLGAAGNVMPRIAFEPSGASTREMGELIALAALHATGQGPVWPADLHEDSGFRSGTPVSAFRWRAREREADILTAVEREVAFPLQELPSLEQIVALREASEQELAELIGRGEPEEGLRPLRFHGVNWAARTERELRSGSAPRAVAGTINAVRIGDGVIATGPGEIFTEIGLAVKERSPAAVTLYAGYTNGCISYFPTASEYPLGGYEPTYGNKTYGLPAQVDPDCDRLLVQTAVELIAELFPEADTPAAAGWLASGRLPTPPQRPPIKRPAAPDSEPPA